MSGLLDYFRKVQTKRFLKKWKKSHAIIHSMMEPQGKEPYIHRYYRTSDVCVDIYWSIKKNAKEKHFDDIYIRCSWKNVKEEVEKIENGELRSFLK